MPGVTKYRGHVAGVNSREYSFADRNTGEKIEGIAHTLFLVTEDEAEPIAELRISGDELAHKARTLNGKAVEVSAEPRARNNRVVWYATAINA